MGEWRPIEEANPVEYVDVVILSRNDGADGVMPAIWDGDEWKGLSIIGMIPYQAPTHFMELPEPPTE